jgi:predicted metal-dependent hydrolase
VRKSSAPSVKLKGTELTVRTKDPNDTGLVKQILTDWYYHHALQQFEVSITASLKRFKTHNLERPQLVIRRMSRRWGSCCMSNRKILLNPEIIKAPSMCIDYVVIHELCHMIHHNHSRAFYRLQNAIMPDWQRWKLRLDRFPS